MTRDRALFGLMCLIWGVTWIAMKASLAAVPPLFLAGTRFTAAGALIAGLEAARGGSLLLSRPDLTRAGAVTVLLVALTYGLLFWGMQFVPSGTAAMLELSLTPVALLGFALLLGHETFSPARALSIALGLAGLALLFGPKATAAGTAGEVRGALAIAAAAAVYALGSVLARPLLRRTTPQALAALTMLAGGALLLAGSWALEPGAGSAARGSWGLSAWAGWLFLVLFGSLGGFTIYLHLLSRWDASRAGAFAFVSPVIAVLAGMAVYGERVSALDGAGMAVMLSAAWLALRTGGESARGEARGATGAGPLPAMRRSCGRRAPG